MDRAEFERLAALFVEDRLSAGDAEALSHLLSGHPELVTELIDLALVEWGIKSYAVSCNAADIFSTLLAAEQNAGPIDPVHLPDAALVQAKQGRSQPGSRNQRDVSGPSSSAVRTIVIPRWVPAAAAIIVVCLGLIPLMGWLDGGGAGPNPRHTAEPVDEAGANTSDGPSVRLVSALGARWEAGKAPGGSASDTALDFGDYALTDGIVHLKYRSGVDVIVQAPAAFRLVDDQTLSLRRGKINATVSSLTGRGFSVESETARVVDLGTEFGFVVDDRGVASTHVYQGEVLVTSKLSEQDNPVLLEQGQATTVDHGGGPMIKTEADELAVLRQDDYDTLKRIESESGPAAARWHAYSYGLRRDPDTLIYYSFDPATIRDNTVTNQARRTGGRLNGTLGHFGPDSMPSRVAGRFEDTGALFFDRHRGQALRVEDWPGFTRDGLPGITIAAWVRIHSDKGWHLIATQWRDDAPELDDRYGIHLGIRCPDHPLPEPGNHPFLIANNPIVVPGPTPQAHLSSNGSQFVHGITNAWRSRVTISNNGPWYLIAFTVDALTGAANLYVDGELVDSGQVIFENGLLPALSHPLVIGDKMFQHRDRDSVGMHGEIDDVLVSRRAYTAEEINALFLAGQDPVR